MSIQSKCLTHTQVGAPLTSLPILTLIFPLFSPIPKLSQRGCTEFPGAPPLCHSSHASNSCSRGRGEALHSRGKGVTTSQAPLRFLRATNWIWKQLTWNPNFLKMMLGKKSIWVSNVKNSLWVSQLGEVSPLGLGGQGPLVLLDRTLVCVCWCEVTRAGRKHWMDKRNLSMSPRMSTQCGEALSLGF